MAKVSTCPYSDLFQRYPRIGIPEYQRPYRWDEQKATDLLNDFNEFFLNDQNKAQEYYMGSILFFKNVESDVYEVIDGQQRLTTLILLEVALTGHLMPEKQLKYNSHTSFLNIKKIRTYFEGRKELLLKLQEHNFLKRLCLTIVVSDNEDNAFAFFESNNNRGVSLSADDYLKAYHLRAVSSEYLQEDLAQEWERKTFNAQRINDAETGLIHLFYNILYRSRSWRGKDTRQPSKPLVLETFQKQTKKSLKPNVFPLFASSQNLRYKEIDLDQSEPLVEYQENNLAKTTLPFAIRQPIYKGYHFFQYVDKYHEIYLELLRNKSDQHEVHKMRKFYDDVYDKNMSVFLRHYMQLLLVTYYDRFSDDQLYKAVQYFDYFIGSIRIDKYYVREEAVKNSLTKDIDHNLLDIISNAYLPDEIFDFITAQNKVMESYKNESLEGNDGVRAQYKQRLLLYYQKTETKLHNRASWIQ